MSVRLLAEVLCKLQANGAMVNGVKNWPDNCDPRSGQGGPCFCAQGYFNAYPAPWKFRVEVRDAQPPMDVFNGTWFVPFFGRVPPLNQCQWKLTLPGDQEILIDKFEEDGSAPDGATVIYDVGFDNSGGVPPRFDGFGARLDQPLPAANLPPGTPAGDANIWPVPVLVIPQAWDAGP